MDDLVQAMGGTGISRSQVSRLCEEIDATCLKLRQGGRIVSVAVNAGSGRVNTDGRHELLGMAIGASEAEPFWTELLRDPVAASRA